MFRIVFESNPDGLKKLLCSLLHMKDSEIVDIEINNPILLGDEVDDKHYILDLNLLLNKAKKIHLELQVLKQNYWTNRSLCYLCKNFSKLNSGDDYMQLKPLIQIDILDFELYEGSKEFYSVYHLANDKTARIYSGNIALHVLELNKEEYATDEDMAYDIDYWAKLFKSTTWVRSKASAR
ncbi:MAG: Rpn family recombination-promoting nuclease/putative transposase [Lachnospiraceae bacterium]